MTNVSRDVIYGQCLFLCFISHYHCFVALIFLEVIFIIILLFVVKNKSCSVLMELIWLSSFKDTL